MLSEDADPIELFQRWYADAHDCGLAEPTAVALATADADGVPSVRMMLLKGVDANGFVFYTNLGSDKAHDLAANPRAALCFHWMPLKRQVRVKGTVQPVSDEEADAYFASRARESRLGAWASRQSQPLEGMLALERRVAKFAARYPIGDIPRPDFWSGFRLHPSSIEFWMQKPFRLHERIRYERTDDGWRAQRLFP
jgi:pyridoxamine 5'-phosphate oxidase